MMRWLIIWALSATLFGVSAAPSGNAVWTACTKAPTRACVFDEALKIARAPAAMIENPVGHVLSAYADVDPAGALRLVPAAETYRKTLSAADARAHLDAALVDVYAKARKFPEAERVLARLKGTSAYDWSLSAMNNRVKTVSAYDAAALALAMEVARAQSVAAAIARLRALGVMPRTTHFRATATGRFFDDIAKLAVERGEEAALMAYAKEVSAAAIKVSKNEFPWADLPVLAVGFAQLEAGKVQPALAAVSQVQLAESRSLGWGWFGSLLTDAGRVDEALAAAAKIGNAVERNSALRGMLMPQGVLRSAATPPARLVRPVRAAEAMRIAAPLSGMARDDAHALIARACAASGAIAEAWAAAREIKTATSSYYALLAIGAAEAKAGNARASTATFARALANARLAEESYMIENLLNLQLSLGQFEAAKAIMREEAANPQSTLDRKSAQYALMLAYAEAGRVDDAFKTTYDDMPADLRRADIAKGLARGGFVKRAVAFVLAGPEPRDEKDRTLFVIVVERAFRGALDDAALALAAISPSGRRRDALLVLAEDHANAGDRTKALPLVREALQLPLPPPLVFDQLDSTYMFLVRAGHALPK